MRARHAALRAAASSGASHARRRASRPLSTTAAHGPQEPLDSFSQSSRLFSPAFVSAAARSLAAKGWFHQDNFLSESLAKTLRTEAETLYNLGDKFQPNMSARYDPDDPQAVLKRFPKKNVLGFEFGADPEGEFDAAPGLLMLTVMGVNQLGPALNERFQGLNLDATSVGHQLAVSMGGGSAFPLHTDNTDSEARKRAGEPTDLRKLTCLFYLNPHWRKENGGQIRLYPLGSSGENPADDVLAQTFEPTAGILLFWSDMIYHDTIPSLSARSEDWRYTLTLWLVTEDPMMMQKLPVLSGSG